MADSYSTRVELQHDGTQLRGFVARPMAEGVYPALIVIQEWWGLVDHIKEVTMRFARQGYVAIAPDLFHGETAKAPDQAMRLSGGVTDAGAMKDLNAAMDHLRARSDVRSDRIGVIGYCFGGRLSLLMGCHNPNLAACCVYYGNPVNREINERQPAHPVDLVGNLPCPLLGIFGENDPSILLDEHVGRLREALRDAGKTFEIHTYPGAKHAFFNDTAEDRYHPEAARDAWTRTLAFFEASLKR